MENTTENTVTTTEETVPKLMKDGRFFTVDGQPMTKAEAMSWLRLFERRKRRQTLTEDTGPKQPHEIRNPYDAAEAAAQLFHALKPLKDADMQQNGPYDLRKLLAERFDKIQANNAEILEDAEDAE